jgi:hypothetical protein
VLQAQLATSATQGKQALRIFYDALDDFARRRDAVD